MYGGYYGGWVPSTYITNDIPLTVYESKAGKPYMDSRDGQRIKKQIHVQEMSY